jgi:hypothetical protein
MYGKNGLSVRAVRSNVFYRLLYQRSPLFSIQIQYDDSDSDSNNITYLLCDVSRS